MRTAFDTKEIEFSDLGTLYEPIRKQNILIDTLDAKQKVNKTLSEALIKTTDK
jgi:hypothetical protein